MVDDLGRLVVRVFRLQVVDDLDLLHGAVGAERALEGLDAHVRHHVVAKRHGVARCEGAPGEGS